MLTKGNKCQRFVSRYKGI